MKTTKRIRKIVRIDEDKCNGCGLCVPNCAEGAIRIIDGKARLVAENLCDGLGACLGKCPLDAITVEDREADDFDEQAVHEHLAGESGDGGGKGGGEGILPSRHAGVSPAHAGGCPGAMMRMLNHGKHPTAATASPQAAGRTSVGSGAIASPASRLGQWPVQMALLPTAGPMWQDADVLMCADCVPFAFAGFHEQLLAGKTLAIFCPKLDDLEPYIEKLSEIFEHNTVRSVTVAHMEVPCCGGVGYVVQQALARSGRTDIAIHDVTVGIDGTIKGLS